MQKYFTYIAYNKNNNLLEIGTTNNISRRFRLIDIKYNHNCKLVFIEDFQSSKEANCREDELLNLNGAVIEELVKSTNPMLIDLMTLQNKY